LPVFNLYLFKSYMADGRAADLPHQHIIPLESPEMRISWPNACRALTEEPAVNDFVRAAGEGGLTRTFILNALAAYVSSLVSGGTRFDQFFYGGDSNALTDAEQRGMRIFVRKARCATCHLLDGFAAPFTDGAFHSVGIGFAHGLYQDHGRMDVTHKATDDGLFKTPTLRNVAERSYFMHDGSIGTLREVIEYYNRGGTPIAINQDSRVRPLFLSEAEIGDLVAFLNVLSSPVQSLRSTITLGHPR
jgi:cytochrome c peroxidase